MKKAKTYSTEANGVFTHVKAYSKRNAVARLQQIDKNVKARNVRVIESNDSHQACVESEFDDVYNC